VRWENKAYLLAVGLYIMPKLSKSFYVC